MAYQISDRMCDVRTAVIEGMRVGRNIRLAAESSVETLAIILVWSAMLRVGLMVGLLFDGSWGG